MVSWETVYFCLFFAKLLHFVFVFVFFFAIHRELEERVSMVQSLKTKISSVSAACCLNSLDLYLELPVQQLSHAFFSFIYA